MLIRLRIWCNEKYRFIKMTSKTEKVTIIKPIYDNIIDVKKMNFIY